MKTQIIALNVHVRLQFPANATFQDAKAQVDALTDALESAIAFYSIQIHNPAAELLGVQIAHGLLIENPEPLKIVKRT